MSYLEIILLAIGLCFDTLAVSMVQGCSCGCHNSTKLTLSSRLKMESVFGFVQGLFIFLGWLLGFSFLHYIEKYDHWIAFGILLIIGGKMVIDSFKEDSDEPSPAKILSFGGLIIAAIATSIDAFTVGISMAMSSDFTLTKIIISFFIVGGITFLAAMLGLRCGNYVAKFLGKKTSLIGGIILISIGVKTLLEHLL